MAGDWIKMRVDLAEDPAVIAMGSALNIHETHVVGLLHKAWSWADRHAKRGQVPGVQADWLDRFIGVSGFSKAMCDAGWLRAGAVGIEFPGFDRHNGESAKARSTAADRQEKVREARKVELRSQLGHNTVTEQELTKSARRSVIPAEMRRSVYLRDSHLCVYCGTKRGDLLPGGLKADISVDHVVPVCDGGKTSIENMVTACLDCNFQKGGRTPEEAGLEFRFGDDPRVVTSSDQIGTREEKSREDSKQSTTLSGKPDDGQPDSEKLTGQKLNAAAVRVLAHLNKTCGTKFQTVPANITPIKARLGEYPEATLLKVIDAKRTEWRGTEQAKYLRPETLFNASKCGSYVGLLDVGAGTPGPGAVSLPMFEVEAEAHDGKKKFLCTGRGKPEDVARSALQQFGSALNGSARNIIVTDRGSGAVSRFSVEELRTQ